MTSAYAVYSDESGCFNEQYQAIGTVSGEKNRLSKLQTTLRNVLDDKGVTEVKFNEVGTHRPKIEAAQAFIEYGVDFAKREMIRIDVLVWDTRNSRHSVQKRDNIANLERMYYKVLRHISEQWNQRNWEFYPDEQSSFNWEEIISYLDKTQLPRRRPNILTLLEEERCYINFTTLKQMESHKEPIIQLSDLFAGMARFTREKGKQCVDWLCSQKRNGQLLLLDYEVGVDESSRRGHSRFALVGKLDNLCKKCRLGVSLNKRKYLWTPSGRRPINFWNYEPQHQDDKAPTK